MKSITRQEIGLTILRVVIGATFIAHGSQKLFTFGIPAVAGMMGKMGIPFPMLSASLVTAAELGGGILLLLGLFTRLAAIPIAFSMLVAILQVHLKGGFFLPTGFEYALVMFAAATSLAIAGGGAFALDNVLAKRSGQRRETIHAAGLRTA